MLPVGTKVLVYIWGLEPKDSRWETLARPSEQWQVLPCVDQPELSVNSLLLAFDQLPNWASEFFALYETQIFSVYDCGPVSPFKSLVFSNRMLEEAWSFVLQRQLGFVLQRNHSLSTSQITAAALASGLAQILCRDMEVLRSSISLALGSSHQPLGNQSSVSEAIAFAACLASQSPNASEEEFRTKLKDNSIALPFKLRSALRLACDRAFAKIWEERNVA